VTPGDTRALSYLTSLIGNVPHVAYQTKSINGSIELCNLHKGFVVVADLLDVDVELGVHVRLHGTVLYKEDNDVRYHTVE
jgi:hypothetical protein